MWATLRAGRPWIGDFTNRRKDGTLFQEEAVITPIHDEAGLPTGYVAVKRDVTAENRLKQRAVELARERALIAETLRGLDGHDAPRTTAEAICRQVVSLSEVALAALFVFDHEGRAEPYGIVIPDEDRPPMRRVPSLRSAYLRDRASSGPWIEAWRDRPSHPYNEILTRLGVRAGAYVPVRDTATLIGYLYVGCATEGAEDLMANNLAALVEFADIAGVLIGAKVAQTGEIESVRRRVRRTIERSAFRPVFQPLVEITGQIVVGYEALTRFDDGAAPDERFKEAVAAGLGEELELSTMRAALEAAVVLPHDAWLSLNVSPDVVLTSRDLPQLLASADRDIVLEITEHAVITDYSQFRAAVAALGSRIRIAVDDAGAGFSSLRHILELQPAFVKLDRSLVKDIDTDQARQALVAGFRHFANATGCVLIAEGVETEPELATLQRLDIKHAQGYLLGRPDAPDASFDGARGRLAEPLEKTPRLTEPGSRAATADRFRRRPAVDRRRQLTRQTLGSSGPLSDELHLGLRATRILGLP